MAYGIRSFNVAITTIIPILSRINPIPHMDIYFFKMYSNIALPSISLVSLPFKFLKTLLPSCILATWPAHVYLDLINVFLLILIILQIIATMCFC